MAKNDQDSKGFHKELLSRDEKILERLDQMIGPMPDLSKLPEEKKDGNK